MDKSRGAHGSGAPESLCLNLCDDHHGGVKTPLESITIDGTAQAGQTLTANLAPAGATATYQWKVADAADGAYTNISGATGKTHRLAADKVGKFVKVEAVGTDKFEGTVLSGATAAVAASA